MPGAWPAGPGRRTGRSAPPGCGRSRVGRSMSRRWGRSRSMSRRWGRSRSMSRRWGRSASRVGRSRTGRSASRVGRSCSRDGRSGLSCAKAPAPATRAAASAARTESDRMRFIWCSFAECRRRWPPGRLDRSGRDWPRTPPIGPGPGGPHSMLDPAFYRMDRSHPAPNCTRTREMRSGMSRRRPRRTCRSRSPAPLQSCPLPKALATGV